MIYKEKEFTLADGRLCRLAPPDVSRAEEILRYFVEMSGESEFLMRYPDEMDITAEQEAAFIARQLESPDVMIICAYVGDEYAGNCEIRFNRQCKTAHRAAVAIGLRRKFWGCGIGTALMRELVAAGHARGVARLELDFIEGNDRARRLYEKCGFTVTGELPDAIRLRDGRRLSLYTMICPLDREGETPT